MIPCIMYTTAPGWVPLWHDAVLFEERVDLAGAVLSDDSNEVRWRSHRVEHRPIIASKASVECIITQHLSQVVKE